MTLAAEREFAAFAFAMPQGCTEAGLTGPTVKLVLWTHGDSLTLNITQAGAEQLHAALGSALKAWPVAETLLANPLWGQ